MIAITRETRTRLSEPGPGRVGTHGASLQVRGGHGERFGHGRIFGLRTPNSYDSRLRGPVPVSAVKGRAFKRWMHDGQPVWEDLR